MHGIMNSSSWFQKVSLGRVFLLSVLSAITWTGSASAGFKGSISFTVEERAEHAANLSAILSESSSCLAEHYDAHLKFYKENGISKYYGDQSSFSRLTTAQQKAALRNLGLSSKLLEEMEPMSCIGLTLKCLGRGFAVAGETPFWEKIKAYSVLNGTDGESLQAALQALGWKILYWNPDPSQNEAWDAAEELKDPGNVRFTHGAHAINYRNSTKRHVYLYNRVDDATSLVGFKTTVPEAFKAVPYFIGTAHMGYHVFSGNDGMITEGHSTRKITDRHELEHSPFNPLTNNGGPRGGDYRSGLIAVPPGYGY